MARKLASQLYSKVLVRECHIAEAKPRLPRTPQYCHSYTRTQDEKKKGQANSDMGKASAKNKNKMNPKKSKKSENLIIARKGTSDALYH